MPRDSSWTGFVPSGPLPAIADRPASDEEIQEFRATVLAKLTLGTAGPRELLALGRSLAVVPRLKEHITPFSTARVRRILSELDEIAELRDRILNLLPHPSLLFSYFF